MWKRELEKQCKKDVNKWENSKEKGEGLKWNIGYKM
jgi:hypothetical protein